MTVWQTHVLHCKHQKKVDLFNSMCTLRKKRFFDGGLEEFEVLRGDGERRQQNLSSAKE